MSKRGGAFIFCRILAPPQCLPPLSPTPQYLTILMTERGGAIIFYSILAPPPHAPLPQTPQYLTILMTKRGRHYVCRSLAPRMPPPSHDATILNYLNNRERGTIIFCRILAPPQCPPPHTLPRRHNTYLS